MKLSRSHFADHLETEGFVAYAVENRKRTMQFGGRDAYHKIALISGIGEIKYDHQVYKISGSILLITKPGINCTWYLSGTRCPSYVCTFKDDFINKSCVGWSREWDEYFSVNPVLTLGSEEEKFVRSIFCRMIDEQTATYPFKDELMQNKICVLTHLAFRMAPVKRLNALPWSPLLSSVVLLELVELRFPAAAQVLHLN
jgi:hypothetical protein